MRRPVVIEVARGWRSIDLGELWRHRELLVVLALRDLRARYKQTVLGVAWVFFQPLAVVLVFTVLFRILFGGKHLPAAAGVPYSLSTCCAVVPWNLFAVAVARGGNSLVEDRALITKVYFPRVIVPAAPLVGALVDFAIAGVFVACLFGYYHVIGVFPFHARWALLTLPAFTLLAVAAALSVTLWVSALNAIYRDVSYTVPFLLQLLMYLTPVVYAAGAVVPQLPAWARVVYGLNPMVGVTEGFRWALLGQPQPLGLEVILSVVVVASLLVGGSFFFRRLERIFADLV